MQTEPQKFRSERVAAPKASLIIIHNFRPEFKMLNVQNFTHINGTFV